MLVTMNLAYADPAITTMTAPTAPTLPSVLSDTTNAASVNADNTSNKVYIDQIGDNIVLNASQTGSGNKIGSGLTTNGLYLRGNNQNLTMIQNGTGNDVEMNVSSGTGANDKARVVISQVGNNNTINATCGMGQSATCTGLNANWQFTGDNNSLSFTGSGANNSSTIYTTGSSNSFVLSTTDNANQLISVTGDSNAFNVDQFGGGTNGQSLNVSLQGNSNTFTSAQGGAVDSLIHVNAVSNNGSFNININGNH